jgi:hypothetical protein
MTKAELEKLPQYLLDRVYLGDRTLGSIYDTHAGLVCKTLELPWRNNQRSVSCIPEGEYLVTLSGPVLKDDPTTEEDESGGRHPRPYSHYIVHGVSGRSGILIHRGYNPSWSQGCILVASRFSDLQTDSPSLEVDGGKKLQYMVDTLPNRFRLLVEAKSGKPYT